MSLRRHLLVALIVCVLLAALGVASATTIAGGNIINQTWTPAGNPYIVNGDIAVPSGAYLRIEAAPGPYTVTGDLTVAAVASRC